ncbi:MAG TPA: helix-turn-helix transcriptional regulator [Buttiauxella sp.]
MTGYDLRLWRKSFGWNREKAAAELGVSLRTYKDYENCDRVKRVVELAALALSCENLLATMVQKKYQDQLLTLLRTMHNASRAPGSQAGH